MFHILGKKTAAWFENHTADYKQNILEVTLLFQ